MQLARGYLGRPDLTDERFLPDPFRVGERIYATGDRAVLREDGAVLYQGRADQQIKIRGMRVEPGEIEAAIRATNLAAECAVLAYSGDGPARLVAWLVPQADYDEPRLMAQLAQSLPAHMLPSSIVTLPALPVTPNGKLDRKALPPPPALIHAGEPARGPVEERLAALFAETLGLQNPPPRDADFFALGGDSLSALTLVLRISETFGHDIGLGQVFESPSIQGLAKALEGSSEASGGLGPVLPLQEGNGPPLFLLHPAGGLGWCYRRLISQLPGQKAYALQSPLLTGGEMPSSLRALSQDYAARILEIAPSGPIHLAGWSLGGILAQEVAVELEAAGRAPQLVALLDAYPAECWRAEPEPDPMTALRALLAIAGEDPEAHPELDSREKLVAYLAQGDSTLGSLPNAVLDGVVQLVTATNRLMREHEHRRYGGTLTHLRASNDHQGRGFESALWHAHAREVIAVDLPFVHAQMAGLEAAQQIAPLLKPQL